MVLRLDYTTASRCRFGKELARSAQCTVPFADRLIEAVLGDGLQCDTGGLEDWWRAATGGVPLGPGGGQQQAALNPESRVMLAEETDAFGMRRVQLDWQTLPVDDRPSARRPLAFAAWLADSDIGRMRIYDWVLTETPIRAASATGRA